MIEQQSTIPENPSFNKQMAIDTIIMVAGILFILLALVLLLINRDKPALKSQISTATLNPTLDPYQDRLSGMAPFNLQYGNTIWSLTPRASYALSARVLAYKNYTDFQSSLIPLDIALGWGDLSDPTVDEWIRWRQSGRWYYYHWSGNSPYGGRDIRNQSANVHIIPATKNIERALKTISPGDIIYLEGMLVDVVGENGRDSFILKTSLSRTDSGGGACEIIYVQKFIFNDLVFE